MDSGRVSKKGDHIHHKMCGHGGKRMMKVWVLDGKDKKTLACFQVDGYEPEASTVYQFHGCHWHEHTGIGNRKKWQEKRYKDTCKIDWFRESNRQDT